jgi:hypothetical protein
MAIATSYLAQVKNLESILDAVKHARAPDRFTNKFLWAASSFLGQRNGVEPRDQGGAYAQEKREGDRKN